MGAIIMSKINMSLEYIINKLRIDKNDVKSIFNIVCHEIREKNEYYALNLRSLFEFAIDNDISLFPKIRVEQEDDPTLMVSNYLTTWCHKYVEDRNNPALKRPLKSYGERDDALIKRVKANTKESPDTLSKYLLGHFIYMSAENANGSILEEFLADVLEPHGWIWCAGMTYRAIDFCFLDPDNIILLQVKNKYNTENSSSSAIRLGTPIKKWNRLERPRKASGLNRPIENWAALSTIIHADDMLTAELSEQHYLDYIQTNSTDELLKPNGETTTLNNLPMAN